MRSILQQGRKGVMMKGVMSWNIEYGVCVNSALLNIFSAAWKPPGSEARGAYALPSLHHEWITRTCNPSAPPPLSPSSFPCTSDNYLLYEEAGDDILAIIDPYLLTTYSYVA